MRMRMRIRRKRSRRVWNEWEADRWIQSLLAGVWEWENAAALIGG